VAIGTAVFAGEWGQQGGPMKFDRVAVSGIPSFRELATLDEAKRACNDVTEKYQSFENSVARQLNDSIGHGFGGLGGGAPHPNEEFVIAAAGSMRARAAIPTLLNQIDRKGEIEFWSRLHHGPTFINNLPAFDALVKIGYPACEAAAFAIASEEDDARRALLIDVIRRGVRRPVGKALLQIALERPSTTVEGAQRIEAALTVLDEPSPKLPRPKTENAEANQEAQ
jgi:hypothetical protein